MFFHFTKGLIKFRICKSRKVSRVCTNPQRSIRLLAARIVVADVADFTIPSEGIEMLLDQVTPRTVSCLFKVSVFFFTFFGIVTISTCLYNHMSSNTVVSSSVFVRRRVLYLFTCCTCLHVIYCYCRLYADWC